MNKQETAMDIYIKEKHTQEECIGFIDGFNVAESLSLTEIEGLKKENERLLELIETAYKAELPIRWDREAMWQLFAKANNIKL
jgi:hypothetical protein